MGEDFELGKINYEAYCETTGGVSLVSGDKLPAFEDLKYEIKNAWQNSAERVFKKGEKSRGLHYIKLLGFTVEDERVLLEKTSNIHTSRYEFEYSIVGDYIAFSANNQYFDPKDRIETGVGVFKLDFTLLHKIYIFLYDQENEFNYDPVFQEELNIFIKHIQEEIKQK